MTHTRHVMYSAVAHHCVALACAQEALSSKVTITERARKPTRMDIG